MKGVRGLRLPVLIILLLVLFPGTPWAAPAEKVLRMSYYQDILTLDPPKITRAPDYPVAMNIFNGLVRYQATSAEVEPDLAQRWTLSPDGKTYTFYLRRGVKFQKGYGDFTARDVKFSFERVADPKLGSPFADQMKQIREIEVVDDYTVKIHLVQPYADFLPAVLAYRPGYIVSPKAVAEFGDRFGVNPVGTGPYMLERYTPRQEIVFAANPDFFGVYRSGGRRVGGKPQISRVTMRIIPDETVQALAMSKGDLDFAVLRTPEALKLVAKDPRLGYVATPVLGRRGFQVNTKRAPLTDVRLRRAVAHSINRKEFVETVFEGFATADDIWSEIPPGMFGHVSDVPAFEYNPERARALLVEAGANRGMRPLVMIIRGADRSFAEAVQGYLTKVGIRMQIDELDAAALNARERAGDWDFLLTGPTRTAPDQLLLPYLSTSVPDFYGRVDDLVHAYRREVDVNKRKEILRKIQVQIASDVPYVPIARPFYVTAFRKAVTGAVPNTHYWLFYWEIMNISD